MTAENVGAVHTHTHTHTHNNLTDKKRVENNYSICVVSKIIKILFIGVIIYFGICNLQSVLAKENIKPWKENNYVLINEHFNVVQNVGALSCESGHHSYMHLNDRFYMLNGKISVLRKCARCSKISEKSASLEHNYINGIGNRMLKREMYVEPDGKEDTVIFGPYIWLPKGTYFVKFEFTDFGWNNWLYYDACFDTGQYTSRI